MRASGQFTVCKANFHKIGVVNGDERENKNVVLQRILPTFF